MKNLLADIRAGSPIFSVETVGDGFVIIPKPGQEAAFAKMIDELSFQSNDEFAIFPITDGKVGYSRATVMPF
ncbi:MAG: hypothetical protein U9R70_14505 [Pseudomonadota bacterium]|jgi:hypothetical protein|uniref:hypothetical protein n=1 Tax=Brevundimonas TaxID=41275 RepID=UPI0012E7E544|nr:MULTISPECIES: hypothetical protein [Brevundimonas]MEA3474622.1 hypothetical protein [Pseudomonadota bacterium]